MIVWRVQMQNFSNPETRRKNAPSFQGADRGAKGGFALRQIQACTRTFETCLSPGLPEGCPMFTRESLSAKGGFALRENYRKRSNFPQISDLPKISSDCTFTFLLTNRLFYFVLLCTCRFWNCASKVKAEVKVHSERFVDTGGFGQSV